MIIAKYTIRYADLGDDLETGLRTLVEEELRVSGLHQLGYNPADAPRTWVNEPVTPSFVEECSVDGSSASLPIGAFPLYRDSDVNVETDWEIWPKVYKTGYWEYIPPKFSRIINDQGGRYQRMELRYFFRRMRYYLRLPFILLFNLPEEHPRRQYATQFWHLTSIKEGARPIGAVMAFPTQCPCLSCQWPSGVKMGFRNIS